MSADKQVFFTGGAGSSACTPSRCCWSAGTRSGSSTTCPAATGRVDRAGRDRRRRTDRAGRALRRRGAQRDARLQARHPLRHRVDQQELRGPVRVDRHQHDRQQQRVRRRRRPRVKRLVFASSASVYGDPQKLPMHEDDRLNPLTPYCISKRAGEDLLGFYQRQKGLSWVALRFFNVYGPGQKIEAYYTVVINNFIQRLRAGQPPAIDGRGEQSMDFVHVTDLAKAVAAARGHREGQRAGQHRYRGRHLHRALAKILIQRARLDVEPSSCPRDVLCQPPGRRHHAGPGRCSVGSRPSPSKRA